MPSMSDLLNQFRQSRFGRALAGVTDELTQGASRILTDVIGEPPTPDEIAARRDAYDMSKPLSLEQRLKMTEVKPTRVQEAFGTPLRELLRLPELPRVNMDRTGELAALGLESPAQGIADWMVEVGNTFPSTGDVAQAMVPFGLKPFSKAQEAIRAARKPDEAFEARMGRVGKRRAGIGEPKNERTVLKDAQGKTTVVGPNTSEDQQILMREHLGTDTKIWDAATWYDQMAEAIAKHYDVEMVGAYKLAFAVTQASNSPMAGIRDVLTAERLAGGQPEPAAPAANATALAELFAGKAPSVGIGQKISEFIDNLFGRKTRTQMNDDPRFGAPVTGDRWEYRANGLVDYAYKQWLNETFGEQARGIKLDAPNDPKKSGVVTEPQFEWLVRQRNKQAAEFNAAKFAGHDDWTPERVQAAAWAAKKIQSGNPPMAIPDMFALYFSKVPMELAWGDNSPYSQFYPDLHQLPWEKNVAITGEVLPKIATALGERFGVRVIEQRPVSGTFETYVNPNVEFTIFGTEKARQDWVQAMAHAANQTAVLAYRIRPEGEGAVGVYDLSAESPLASKQLQDRALLSKYLEALQAKHPKFNSAEVLSVDGKPTIRIVNTTSDFKVPTDAQGNQIGHFTPEEVAAMDAAANATAHEFGEGFDTSSRVHGADITASFNDWKGNPNGEAHLADFNAENRQGIVNWLEGPLRGETAGWIKGAFQKHAPDTWNAHFGEAVEPTSGSSGAGGTARSAGPAANRVEPFKIADLGHPSSVSTFSRGWITREGKLIQVPAGGTHETSLAAVTGVPVEEIAKNYPAYAAKGDLIRFSGQMDKNGYGLTAEIFKDPSTAQVKALKALQSHAQKNVRMYDRFHFVLKDPLTNQVIGTGTNPDAIQGTVRDTNFDIPF